MLLRYFGNSAFELTTASGYKVLIDPFQNSSWNRWFKNEMPRVPANVVLISHDHFDHNATDRALGSPLVIDQPGHFKGPDLELWSIAGKHARPKWSDWWGYGQNLIFVLQTENVRLCHWGDNNADLNPRLRQAIGHVDVLLLPVDESQHLLDWPEVEKIVQTLAPKVIIPMHYRLPEFNTVTCPLQPIDHWLSNRQVQHFSNEGTTLNSAVIADMPREVWTIEPAIHEVRGFSGI